MISNFMHCLSGALANFQLNSTSHHNGEASRDARIGRGTDNHYIFRRPMPDGGFMSNPKHVARCGQQKIPSVNVVAIDDPPVRVYRTLVLFSG